MDASRPNLANFGGCTSEKAKELEGAADKASAEVQDLQQEVDVLNATLSACDFQFRDPEAKFDRSGQGRRRQAHAREGSGQHDRARGHRRRQATKSWSIRKSPVRRFWPRVN